MDYFIDDLNTDPTIIYNILVVLGMDMCLTAVCMCACYSL